jgi:5'-deoxynucleotidase YfbR-like HD superfamily hydrolase
MLTFEQLKLALKLHIIQRFQTHRLQQRKSVGEHSFRVAVIYDYLGGTETIAALCHDIEEAETGDIPSPAKAHIKGLEYFEKLRPEFKDKTQKKLAKLADKLELVLDLREQLDDVGKLPKRLMEIYEEELELVYDLAKELNKIKEVKQLLKDLAK